MLDVGRHLHQTWNGEIRDSQLSKLYGVQSYEARLQSGLTFSKLNLAFSKDSKRLILNIGAACNVQTLQVPAKG